VANRGIRGSEIRVPGLAAAPDNDSGAGGGDHRNAVYLAAIGLVILFAAIVIVALTTLTGSGSPGTEAALAEKTSKLPVYWKVHTGDSYESIAEKTGLSVDDIERFNPYVNPDAIQPGDRLQLRAKVPPPKAPPPGPRFYTVRSGDTIASIAARTHHSIDFLLALNPKIDPTAMQPGLRIRLRAPSAR
jgi:LysM repeat protein